MVTPRRVTYVSVKDNNADSVITGAETWRQLKDEFPQIAAKAANGMKPHIKETQMELTREEQVLPTGDFTLYFLIEKNKSGNKEVEEAVEEYLKETIVPALEQMEVVEKAEETPF